MSTPKTPLALRLEKIPERTPVKLTITLDRTTHALLAAYAEAYRSVYGVEEALADLIPFMLKQFVGSDQAFARMRAASRANDTNKPQKGD